VKRHKLANKYPSAVVSMSLGGPRSASLNDAVEDLAAAGIVSIVAAGNNRGADACTQSPASAPSAITVGSSTNQVLRTCSFAIPCGCHTYMTDLC
jgi:subtilisin family serine protease